MLTFLPTLILRHRKENLKKCSLTGLENRSDLHFLTYPKDPLPCLGGYFLLDLDAPPITEKDFKLGLLLVDGTWKYAEVMQRQLPPIPRRSIPAEIRTSYPRKQTQCSDPERGLASVEALYIALLMLKRNPEGLLDHYYWKESFLEKNRELIELLRLDNKEIPH